MSISTEKRFISFEGIDGCGKSTQARFLVDYLEKNGQTVVFVREPGGTAISEDIRQILLDNKRRELADRTESLLMTASRAQLTQEIILPALEDGKWVLADRYTDSTLAYQGSGRKLDLEWLIELNHYATFGLRPTLTYVFDIEAVEGIRRRSGTDDRIEEAGLAFQEQVRQGYLNIAERFSDRIIVLDGHEKIAALQAKVIDELHRRFQL